MTTIKARPTLYRGIQMRSRLEADYATSLDNGGETWEYEPECFANADGQWLPDFSVGTRKTLIEVKPAGLLKAEIAGTRAYFDVADEHLRRMTIAWSSRPDAPVELVFWTYGGPAALRVASACQMAPWFAWTAGDDVPALLWPGMGQLERLSGALHDIGAEQAVLGAMFLSRSAVPGVLQAMRPEDHWRPAHQIIHETILDLYGRGEPVDAVTVAADLTRRGEIKLVGGAPYLRTLLENASFVSDEQAALSARLIADFAVARRSS